MDALREFLDNFKEHHSQDQFLGLLHLLIGRRITKTDGTLVSSGLTWRDLAAILKKVRWDTEDVRALGLGPDELAARDRERYWYSAILRAGVDSAQAIQAAEQLAEALRKEGYVISASSGK
jgi:hypothetical protein